MAQPNPNQFNPGYIEEAQTRELSMAFRLGDRAFQYDGTDGQKWVSRTAVETDALASDGFMGDLEYQQRVKNYVTNNTYGDSLRMSASQVFDRRLVLNDWPEIIVNAAIAGRGGGLDGRGSTVLDLASEAYECKLFAGAHYLRAVTSGGRLMWVQANANSVLFLKEEMRPDGPIVVEAVVQGVTDGRKIIRTWYGLSDNRRDVQWAQFVTETPYTRRDEIYAPCSIQAITYDFLKIGEGTMVGLGQVPVIEFSANKEKSPPCEDAAHLQLDYDRRYSHLQTLNQKIADSASLVADNLGRNEETQEVNQVPRTAAVIRYPNEGSVKAVTLDMSHPEQVSKQLEDLQETIRRKCFDPLDQGSKIGTLATEIRAHERRAGRALEILFKRDKGAIETLLRLDAAGRNIRVSSDAVVEFTRNKTGAEKTQEIEQVATWQKDGIVPPGAFTIVLEDLSDLPRETLEKIKQLPGEKTLDNAAAM
jgi:hypothetical protein